SVSTTSFTLSFTDVAPVVSSDQASVTVAENAQATNTGHWSDYDDGVTLSASYGTVVKHNDGSWSWSATGDEADSQTVTITATNDDGSVSTTSCTLSFTDVAPVVSSDQASVT